MSGMGRRVQSLAASTSRFRLRATLFTVLVAAAFVLVSAGTASALSGRQPIVVVLCNFKDKTDEPSFFYEGQYGSRLTYPGARPYFEDMFSEKGAGTGGVFDYWRDISYAQLDRDLSVDLTGSVVKGWYTLPKTVAQWIALDNHQKIDTCASQARQDVDFNNFAGVAVLVNLPIENPSGHEQKAHGYYPPTTIAGKEYGSLGRMVAAAEERLSVFVHETGHVFRFPHSRALSQYSEDDYYDPYDIMSCIGCYMGYSPWRGYGDGAGPGMNVINLAKGGWIPAERRHDFPPTPSSGCLAHGFPLAALNHPGTGGALEARIPAAIPIQKKESSTTSDYYALEFREKSGWDAAIPGSTVRVLLHGQDGLSYWVDKSGYAGNYYYRSRLQQPRFNEQGRLIAPPLTPGAEYVDPARKVYVAVHRFPSPYQAEVTISACKLRPRLLNLAPASADFGDSVTLSADLIYGGSRRAPVPRKTVTFNFGSQYCQDTTNLRGHAECKVTVNQPPGSYTLRAYFNGDPAYRPTNASTDFTIRKEATRLTYTGATTADYHDAFTASATLVEPDGGGPIAGKNVTFTLGSSDTCSATTDSAGSASCSITPSAGPGANTITPAFAGDPDYLPSSVTQPFTVTGNTEFTDWTVADGTSDVASGALRGVSVTLSGSHITDPGSTLDGTSTVFADPWFTPPLPRSDAIEFHGWPDYSYVLQFGAPIRNPVLHLGSLASKLEFPAGTQITRVSGENDSFAVSGSSVTGALDGPNDANGTVRLEGVFQSIPFSATPVQPLPQPDGVYIQVGW